jgi:hypothetical protein
LRVFGLQIKNGDLHRAAFRAFENSTVRAASGQALVRSLMLRDSSAPVTYPKE